MKNQRKNVIRDRLWISDSRFFDEEPILGEIWLDCTEYNGYKLKEGYKASNKGRILTDQGKIMIGSISFDGYHEVNLIRSDDRSIPARVHRVILQTFVGYPPSDMKDPTVQHLNHDKLDNRVENLCWMSAFENNQDGHGTKTKIIDSRGEHIFGSQKEASAYIGRHDDYISEGVHYGYILTDSDGNEIDELYLEKEGEWVKYVVPDQRNKNRCKLITEDGEFEFRSYQQCDRFLGKLTGYITNCILNSWPILPDVNHQFFIVDHNTGELQEYKPTSKKKKNFAIQCRVTLPSGSVQMMPSIKTTAALIGRGEEYVRGRLHAGKPIQDKDGNTIEIEMIEN